MGQPGMLTDGRSSGPGILVIDIGGTNVKMLATGHKEPREFASGPEMTPDTMVAAVRRMTTDWSYDVVSVGYPGMVAHGRPVAEPHNLGRGWVGFDFGEALRRPTRVINDAALQALGGYHRGRMLYLGFGTGLGSAMVVDGVLAPLELAHLPYRSGRTYEDYVGARGLQRLGKTRWRRHVVEVIALLRMALQADDVVVGGGNANRLKELPPGVRKIGNETAFIGGYRLWNQPRPEAARTIALVEVHPTAETLMRAAAETFVRAASDAIGVRGRFTVALAGGTTPKDLYMTLASDSRRGRVDWRHVEVFWGDERCVPPDHAESNYRMAREAVLDHPPVSEARVHRIHGEDDPASAAAAYERELRMAFATPAGPPRHAPDSRFDLVLLGMGEDGHTASLFPGSVAVQEEERWVVEDRDPDSMWRVTLTPPVINAAAEVVILVSGTEKAAALRRVIDGPYQPMAVPAQVVAPRAGRLRWMVDAEAAGGLR